MRQNGTPNTQNVRNAWGRYSDVTYTRYTVEVSDVGKTWGNYQGHGHASYTFTASDVGRDISKMTDRSAWQCWGFI